MTTGPSVKAGSFEDLVELTVGDIGEIEDFEPEITAFDIDPDALKVFMGQCHCSLASPL